jgi:peptidoglycan/xylan/chitin deacetylase (PgdA/CDA1 family)
MKGIDFKYRFFWQLGTVFGAILYFSGIYWFYLVVRKKFFKRYRTIVLTYHRVRDDTLAPDISVSLKKFREQIDFLRQRFEIISLQDVVNTLGEKLNKGRDRVAITFDDGYKDNYLHAFPILKDFNIPATIFLISQFINNKDEFLNTAEIKEMRKWNISFECHTATHPILSEINPEIARQEIINSKAELESLLNEKILFFTYPKGKRRHLNDFIKGQIKTAGYKAAFTAENDSIEKGSDPFALKRIGIRDCPMFVFKTRVSGIFESKLVYFIRIFLKMT